MKGRMRFPTTVAFVIAALLLSPHIIVLSFSVLGFRYGVLRILSSFLLAMLTVMVLGAFDRKRRAKDASRIVAGCDKNWGRQDGDIYFQTFAIFKRLLPFLIVAGGMGVLLQYFSARDLVLHGVFGDGFAGIMTWILVGVPLYFCHGAEVVFLRPLMNQGFPVGTGIAFSLTSTAICTTSIVTLFRLISGRLTVILIGCIISISRPCAHNQLPVESVERQIIGISFRDMRLLRALLRRLGARRGDYGLRGVTELACEDARE
jgi:uncharacterized membrane protein YraQ (UPF0718 family)